MQGGMGGVVFGPWYPLSARGVTLRYFDEIAELVQDGDAIGSIRVTRQVRGATASVCVQFARTSSYAKPGIRKAKRPPKQE